MSKETGGPAFDLDGSAFSPDRDAHDYHIELKSKVTLRDYFAGQALSGLCANDRFDSNPSNIKQAGVACYALADLLLEEREK